MAIEEVLKSVIRDIPDFPQPSVVFKDITPIMLNPAISEQVLNHLVELYKNQQIDVVAGIESRGFLFGFPLAIKLGVPFVLIRKKGKLPYKKISHDYQLEYGTSTIEMHTDAIQKGQKVLIHDDLLATGGSAEAAAHLIQKCGGEVAGFNFLVGLDFLNGQAKLNIISHNIISLATY
ncbi:MAG: adenine phosphoribosyltransferase [Crocinitomicaceae bacterium]|nr:adenine phosphoribosyltransferase [Crocinitomicaceae bacterium]